VGSPPPSAVPAQAGSGYSGGGPDERGDSTSGASHRGPAGFSGPGGLGLGLDPAVLVPVATWSLTTAFGVLVFGLGLMPVRRRRDPARGRRSWIGRAASSVAVANESGPIATPEPARSTGASGGSTPRPWGAAGSVDEAGPGGLTSTVREPLRFQAPPRPGVERRTIAYRLIRVADQPDATGSSEICRLDRGDEIEIIGEHEGYLQIKTPTGIEGWVQRMVIVG
jgi:SH3 domain-containing protein